MRGWGFRRVLLLACMLPMACFALSDPTKPPVMHKPAASATVGAAVGFVLSSTLVTNARRVAVINGVVVGAGDKIEDAIVISVSDSEVVLRSRGRLLKLRLLDNIKR